MNFSGARWWKFDFHMHSPASNDYGKDEFGLRNLTAREWLLELMKREIDCIALTDHNTGAWIDILKAELVKMKEESCEGYRDIYIFPGMEITVNGGIHLLAIFDLDKTSVNIAELRGAIGYNGTDGDSDGCTDKSFKYVVEEINRRGGIAIPAHVDIDSGLFIEEQGTTLESILKDGMLVAIELCDTNFKKPQIYTDLKLNLTEVIGSDSHKPEAMARNFTWVKMEKPSLEALWLALHDGQDGILRSDKYHSNPNNIKSRFFIKKLIIKNGAKIGRGNVFEVEFSPWMSTIIGGRGSGKSSILNFIRFVLDEEKNLTESLKKDFEEFIRISEGRNQRGMLLKDTEIRLEVWKDNRDIALVWKNGEVYEEHIDNVTKEWIDKGKCISISDRFPVRIFSQKELYEITKNPRAIISLIDKQINKHEIDEEIKILKDRWFQSRGECREILQSLENKKEYEVKLEDTKAKMKLLEESDYKVTLEEYKKMKDTEGLIEIIHNDYNNNNDIISNNLDGLKTINISDDLLSSLDKNSKKDLELIVSKSNIIMNNIKKSVEEYLNLENEWNQTFIGLDWNKYKQEIENKYNDLVSGIGSKNDININTYEQLINYKKQLEIKIKDISEKEIKYSKKKQEGKEIYNQIIEKYKELEGKRKEIINRWNELNLSVKLNLSIMGDAITAEKQFREIIRKTDDRLKKDIYDVNEDGDALGGFIHKLCMINSEDNAIDIWKKREQLIKEVYDYKNHSSYGYSRNFQKHIERLRKETPEDIDRLVIWLPDDKVDIKIYENGKAFDVGIGSAGQRTAAILSLILSLDDSPLFIDQPEDDLDTKRISDLVVEGLRGLKGKQQVIVVTHNPNIPVNGAAEQIIQVGFLRGGIQKQVAGALQQKKVREAICDVMEGGAIALNNRYHRIYKALE